MRFRQVSLVLMVGVFLACGKPEKQAVTPTSAPSPRAASVPSTAKAPVVPTNTPTTVTVHVTGLASIGDGNPSGNGGLPSKMLYLMNARSASHYAVVMARNRFQPASDRPMKYEGLPPGSPFAFRRVDLDGDPLEFGEVVAADNPLKYSESEPSNVCPNDS